MVSYKRVLIVFELYDSCENNFLQYVLNKMPNTLLPAVKLARLVSSVKIRKYIERGSNLDFKDAAIPRFGHSDVVFDLFIEASFSHLITLLSNFIKTFLAFQLSLDQNNLTLCYSTTNSVYLVFPLMIDRRYLLIFVTKNRQETTSL